MKPVQRFDLQGGDEYSISIGVLKRKSKHRANADKSLKCLRPALEPGQARWVRLEGNIRPA